MNSRPEYPSPVSPELARLFSQARQQLDDDFEDPRTAQGVRALVELGQDMGVLRRVDTKPQFPQPRIVR